MIRVLSVTLLLFFMLPSLGEAAEILRFKNPESLRENKAIELISELSDQYKIAKIDLNDDLIDEYIIKPSNDQICGQNKLCRHIIVAYRQDTPLTIGEFNAHKILILNEKTYGIRDLIVYNDAYNDFKNVTARWNPFNFKYQTY